MSRHASKTPKNAEKQRLTPGAWGRAWLLLLLLLFSFQSQPVAQLGVRYMAVLCTGASRALEPHGQVPLRIAANLRPTQLVKRLCMIALVVLSAARSAWQEPECKMLDQCGIIRQPSLRLSLVNLCTVYTVQACAALYKWPRRAHFSGQRWLTDASLTGLWPVEQTPGVSVCLCVRS